MSSCSAAALSSFALSEWKYVVEGVLAVEPAESHDGDVHVLAAHHYQVAEESAGVEQGDA